MAASRMPDSSRLAGAVTAANLLAGGTSPAQLRRLVRQGALVRLTRGGYAPAALTTAESGNRAGKHAVLVAAVLAVIPGTVASHTSAALMHGLDLLGATDESVAVIRPPGGTSSRTGRPGVRLHIATLPDGHVTARRGLPITSVARTVIDLARTFSFPAGVVVADSALRAKQTSKDELLSVSKACAHWPGIQIARRVVEFSDGRSESVLESISRVAFHEQGLPAPDLQAWIGDETEPIGRADFLWRAYRTIGEADGAIKYADPSRAMAQLHRDKRLREAGFEVVHFTWAEITRTPSQVAASILAAFRRGARNHSA